MKVLSWNVNGAFPTNGWSDKIRHQIEFLKKYEQLPDILLLQEVNANQRELWRDLLRSELRYEGIEDTLDWANELRQSSVQPHHEIGHTNGNLTAVKDTDAIELKPLELLEGAYEDTDVKHLSTHYPEKILVTDYTIGDTEIEIWNVRAVPGSMKGEEKIKILETVFNRIVSADERPRVLAGDFNTPDEELPDGQAIVHVLDKHPEIRNRWLNAEINILKGLGHAGLVDTFRYLHGYGDLDIPDTSFKNSRFDHIFASESLQPEDCWYDHDAYNLFDDNSAYSDHAPIIATFTQ